jgi:hypothetical protein
MVNYLSLSVVYCSLEYLYIMTVIPYITLLWEYIFTFVCVFDVFSHNVFLNSVFNWPMIVVSGVQCNILSTCIL